MHLHSLNDQASVWHTPWFSINGWCAEYVEYLQTKESVWLSWDYPSRPGWCTIGMCGSNKGQQSPSTHCMPRWPNAVLTATYKGGTPTLLTKAEEEAEARGLENPLKVMVKAALPRLVYTGGQAPRARWQDWSLTGEVGACCGGLFQGCLQAWIQPHPPTAWNNNNGAHARQVTGRAGWNYRAVSWVTGHPGPPDPTAPLVLFSPLHTVHPSPSCQTYNPDTQL